MPGQLNLFAEEQTQPQGFCVETDFITLPEERALIEWIGELPLAPFQFGAFEGKRRVASFGWHYDYSLQRLQRAGALPDLLLPFTRRIEAFFRLAEGAIQQVLCTEYDEGVGIGWHRDKPHFDEIFGLSLASACKFRFRRKQNDGWQRLSFDVAPRSIYRMSDESRHAWEHSIPAVPARRCSITFRTLAARERAPANPPREPLGERQCDG